MPNVFTDEPAKIETYSTLRPVQEAVQNQALGRVSELLGSSNSFNFAPIEKQARENFQKKTIPTLAERFVGGGARGSAFQASLGSAGADLDTNLAALGAEYGLRNQESQQHHLTNLLQLGLGKSFETTREPSQPSLAKKAVEKGGEKLVEYGVEKGLDTLFGGNEQASTAGKAAGSAAAGAAGAGAVKAAPSLYAKIKTALGFGAPAEVVDTVANTAAASSDPGAWANLATPIALIGSLFLIHRKINQLEAEGKAEEAAQEKQRAANLQQHYNDVASGKFGNPGGAQWPKRGPNEDLGVFLQRVIAFNKQQYPQGGQ